jgi:L-ascorbate oxidase
LALNQVSSGLAGIITIGGVGDYLSGPWAHSDHDPAAGIKVRHLVLKDMQVLSDGKVFSQQEPEFCAPDPVDEPLRDGFCPGQSVY